jgi:nitronate monooxygenase
MSRKTYLVTGISSRLVKDLAERKTIFAVPVANHFYVIIKTSKLDQQKWDIIIFWSGQISQYLWYTVRHHR